MRSCSLCPFWFSKMRLALGDRSYILAICRFSIVLFVKTVKARVGGFFASEYIFVFRKKYRFEICQFAGMPVRR